MDIYLPDGVSAPPCVVSIHGGGWFLGDKTGYHGEGPVGLEAFLGAGFAVAAINYRLSGEALWPAQRADVLAAIDVLQANGAAYGLAPNRLASFGDSAGGHLSAIAGLSRPQALCAAVVWYPPVVFSAMDADIEATGVARTEGRNDAPGSPEARLIGAPIGEAPDRAWEASPLRCLQELAPDAVLPPMLILHGDRDPLIGHGQSRRLAQALSNDARARSVELGILAGGHGDADFLASGALPRTIRFLKEGLV